MLALLLSAELTLKGTIVTPAEEDARRIRGPDPAVLHVSEAAAPTRIRRS